MHYWGASPPVLPDQNQMHAHTCKTLCSPQPPDGLILESTFGKLVCALDLDLQGRPARKPWVSSLSERNYGKGIHVQVCTQAGAD
jgi:hypothetical protein